MLISFTVENFRSIKDPLTLSLTTEKRLREKHLPNNSFETNDIELLPSLLLYGRNASGKSNVLKAIPNITKIAPPT